MKIIIASSSAATLDDCIANARALSEWLVEKGHRVERLDLPSPGAPREALRNLASYRLIATAGSADALICLDPVASVLPYPRKLLWLLDDWGLVATAPNAPAEKAYVAAILRKGLSETRARLAPSPTLLKRLTALGCGDARLFAPQPRASASAADAAAAARGWAPLIEALAS